MYNNFQCGESIKRSKEFFTFLLNTYFFIYLSLFKSLELIFYNFDTEYETKCYYDFVRFADDQRTSVLCGRGVEMSNCSILIFAKIDKLIYFFFKILLMIWNQESWIFSLSMRDLQF